jgi:hypothetical protein
MGFVAPRVCTGRNGPAADWRGVVVGDVIFEASE